MILRSAPYGCDTVDSLRAAMLLLLLIFSFRGHSSPNVPFLFVFIQNLPNLKIQRIITLGKTFRQCFMDSGFGNAEFPGRRANRGTRFDHVHSQCAGPFFQILFHRLPSDAVLLGNPMRQKDGIFQQAGHQEQRELAEYAISSQSLTASYSGGRI